MKRPVSKEDLLKGLVTELANQKNIKNIEYLSNAIVDRERESSTFLPTGIAIPHARVPDVEEITLIMGVMPEGFKETQEADPTYLVFLFFSPIKDKEFGRHLKLLAKIAAIFNDPTFVHDVAVLSDSDKIFASIQHKERESADQ
jgi:mannitol/fructose-specific phosphotransferase system IIA component (Ntr-type)